MEKYSKAVSEMYSQFKQREAHPMEKYIGRRTVCRERTLEVVGYTSWPDGSYSLIVDSSKYGGWVKLDDRDVIFKKCDYYLYERVNDLID